MQAIMTRHITVSAVKGMVTELEVMGQGFGPSHRYILRYHKSESAAEVALDMSIPEAQDCESWTGFHYKNNQLSVLMPLQSRSSGMID
jgi:hypothetical protein